MERDALRARLLDAAALARYDGLTLAVRRGLGERAGERRFPGRPQASGIELEAYGAYTPGDDLRHLDWNVLGRLDTLVVRRFTAEREVLFHLLIDTSASMDVPASDGKLAVALELAMALAFMALSANDGVRVALLGDAGWVSPVHRQRASAIPLADVLAGVRAGGPLALGEALEAYARRHPRPGAALVISDFMAEPAEIERGVHALRARRYDVLLLHVLGRGELEPEHALTSGVLADVESGETHPMALTASALARYRALLDAHLSALAALAASSGALYVRLTSDEPVAAFVMTRLARLGVVRRR